MSRKGPSYTGNLSDLPELPKSLSGLINVHGTWRKEGRLHAMKTMINQDLSRGSQQKNTKVKLPVGASMDAALAILRKEMVGLRQLDMSLLSQLWSLNEAIQEYKTVCQDSTPLDCSCDGGYEEPTINGHVYDRVPEPHIYETVADHQAGSDHAHQHPPRGHAQGQPTPGNAQGASIRSTAMRVHWKDPSKKVRIESQI